MHAFTRRGFARTSLASIAALAALTACSSGADESSAPADGASDAGGAEGAGVVGQEPAAGSSATVTGRGGTGEKTGAGNTDQNLVDEDMAYLGTTRRPAANVAVALMVISVLLHAFAVIAGGRAKYTATGAVQECSSSTRASGSVTSTWA